MDIIGDELTRMIKPSDKVIDAGSGIGAISLAVAPLCKKVIAVDENPKVMEILRHRMVKQGICNIKPLVSDWIDAKIEPCDVAICTYSIGISRNPIGLQKLWMLCNRGLIITPKHAFLEYYAFSYIAERLGLSIKRGHKKSCIELDMLERLGAEVSCQSRAHDFGQPVDDLDEAWEYVKYRLRISNDFD